MAIIFDEHLKIYNTELLADFIRKRIKHKYGNDFYFDVQNLEDGYITGFINGAPFMIIYNYGINCSLEIAQGYPETTKKFMNIIQPVMWKICEDANNPDFFTQPLFSYTTNDNSVVIEWDVYDPKERLKRLAFDVKNGLDAENIEIYYNKYKLEDFDEDLKYGAYTGFISGNDLRTIDNYTEMELYLNMKATSEKCEALQEANHDDADGLVYNVCYLMQQAKKFGVNVNAPADLPPDPTIEILAWLKWWTEGLNKALEENPKLIEEWASMPKSYDPNFRPKGSFKDFLDKAEEIDREIK